MIEDLLDVLVSTGATWRAVLCRAEDTLGATVVVVYSAALSRRGATQVLAVYTPCFTPLLAAPPAFCAAPAASTAAFCAAAWAMVAAFCAAAWAMVAAFCAATAAFAAAAEPATRARSAALLVLLALMSVVFLLVRDIE
jgi:hypothetical protein